jgi:hypothetical protein
MARGESGVGTEVGEGIAVSDGTAVGSARPPTEQALRLAVSNMGRRMGIQERTEILRLKECAEL